MLFLIKFGYVIYVNKCKVHKTEKGNFYKSIYFIYIRV